LSIDELEKKDCRVHFGTMLFHTDDFYLHQGSLLNNRANTAERVKHGVARERKHADETGCQFHWKWGGMLLGGCSWDIPDLLKPLIEFTLGYLACFALCLRWLPVSSGLALHEDEFHVVLDNCVRFVGFSQELRSILNFVGGVCNFMPNDWIQVVESNPSADDADVGV
jgi:hypothetical protein